MKHFLIFILIFSLFSCKSKNEKLVRRTETKLFGDSLKIDYTYIGDTIYQKRTDLKGKKDDGFDNSFEVKSVWSTKETSDLNCEQKVKISNRYIDYIFCLDDVLKQTQKELNNRTEIKWSKDSILKLQKELLQIERAERDTLSSDNFFMIYNFVRNLDFIIFDQVSNSKVQKVRIENYKTKFAGGHIYYLINKQQDTLASYNLLDWSKQ